MKKVIYMIFILCTSIMISACSNSLKEDNLKLTEQISTLNNENQSLKNEVLKLEASNEDLNKDIAYLQEKLVDSEGMDLIPNEGESLFKIYGANVDTYQKEIVKELILKDELPLKEKLDTIADNLSKVEFSGLGIDVTEIESKEGKKIAIVDLTEKTNEKSASWNTGYFQGSTGGTITATSLSETFLQREYAGEWVDGVKFLYEGEEIKFDHVEGLGEVSYR